MPTRKDKIIEAIFDALPSDSYATIADDVGVALKQEVTVGDVNNAIATVRRASAEHGWSIPHVKRGAGGRNDDGRYFAVLVDRDGTYTLDNNPEQRAHLNRGALATAQHAATMLANEMAALRIAATNSRSVNQRALLNDLADDFTYTSRKAAALVRTLRNGTDG